MSDDEEGRMEHSNQEDPGPYELYEDKLLQLYKEMILVATAKVYNQSDVQDVVQEAWVRILSNRRSLREEDKLNAWAKTITANTASNMNKQAKRCSPYGDRNLPAETGTSRNENEIMLEIREMLESLDPRTGALLLYKFYYGYRDKEIAAAWKMPIGTIKARLHRTKRRLQQWMTN